MEVSFNPDEISHLTCVGAHRDSQVPCCLSVDRRLGMAAVQLLLVISILIHNLLVNYMTYL
jgi:hypothetical protein